MPNLTPATTCSTLIHGGNKFRLNTKVTLNETDLDQTNPNAQKQTLIESSVG